MTMLPNERVIPLSLDVLTLTTHRLRLVTSRQGPFSITSMMLEELASCAAVKREVTLLLVLAVLIAVCGTCVSVFGRDVGPGGAIMGVVVGGLIALLYLATRRTALVFASQGGAQIEIYTGHMDPAAIETVIDTIEQAKDRRARSLTVGGLASAATQNGKADAYSPGRSAASRPEPAMSRVPTGRGLASYFYVDLDGQVAGPVTAGELKRLVDDGAVSMDTQVCAEGTERWQALDTAVAF